MKTQCSNCGKVINKRPSELKKQNYCNKKCRYEHKRIDCKCEVCGKGFQKLESLKSKHDLCSLECSKIFTSKRMSKMNVDLNPTRMNEKTKDKIRQKHFKPNRVSYKKIYGRHEHRILMEQKIGRKLKKGEVVHHIDGNIQNNNLDNLHLFKNQAEHARYHKLEQIKNNKNVKRK